MVYQTLNITHGQGRLAFTLREDSGRPWWRDLDLDGQPLCRIGNICGTCQTIFDRHPGVQTPLAPEQLSARLRAGLTDLPEDVVNTVAALLPNGQYAIGLLNIQPTLNPEQDYRFDKPGIHYFKQESHLADFEPLPELFLPLIETDQYHQAAVSDYEAVLVTGKRPTALALSMLEVRWIRGQFFVWELAHFLLDRHHKMMAASQVHKPITLLSFFALDASFAPEENIEKVLNLRYMRPTTAQS